MAPSRISATWLNGLKPTELVLEVQLMDVQVQYCSLNIFFQYLPFFHWEQVHASFVFCMGYSSCINSRQQMGHSVFCGQWKVICLFTLTPGSLSQEKCKIKLLLCQSRMTKGSGCWSNKHTSTAQSWLLLIFKWRTSHFKWDICSVKYVHFVFHY